MFWDYQRYDLFTTANPLHHSVALNASRKLVDGKLRLGTSKMRKLAKYAIAAVVIAVIAQAMWESPLVTLVHHITWLGGRTAWGIDLRPGWGFDVVASTVNAVVYLTAMLALDAVVRRLMVANRDR
jgi:hypothetical protein